MYLEDSAARVDLERGRDGVRRDRRNPGDRRGEAVPRATIDAMVDIALKGIAELVVLQRAVLAGAGVDLAALTIRG